MFKITITSKIAEFKKTAHAASEASFFPIHACSNEARLYLGPIRERPHPNQLVWIGLYVLLGINWSPWRYHQVYVFLIHMYNFSLCSQKKTDHIYIRWSCYYYFFFLNFSLVFAIDFKFNEYRANIVRFLSFFFWKEKKRAQKQSVVLKL